MTRHRYRRGIEVEVPWLHEEQDYRVRLYVGPDEKEIRWGDNACPASPGEVEILEVYEDAPGTTKRPDLMDAAEDDLDHLGELAREAAADAARDAMEREAEAQEEARREARMFKEDW